MISSGAPIGDQPGAQARVSRRSLSMRVEDWFLSTAERGNPHSDLDRRCGDGLAWTTGNDVQPLIDGHTAFDGPGTGISRDLCRPRSAG